MSAKTFGSDAISYPCLTPAAVARTIVFVSDPGEERTRATSSRAVPFSAGATASSRSATTASAPDSSAPRSLCSSLPGAKRSERTWESSTVVLDSLGKVRHKRNPLLEPGGPSVKAVVFHEFGGVDVLKLEEVADPQPGPGEVLLEIGACALNHLHLGVRE